MQGREARGGTQHRNQDAGGEVRGPSWEVLGTKICVLPSGLRKPAGPQMCQGLGAAGEAWKIQGHCLPLSPALEDIWAETSPGITRGMTVHPVPVEELGLGEAEERNNSKTLAGGRREGRVPHLHTAGGPKFNSASLWAKHTKALLSTL